MTTIRLYNTAKRAKQDLVPIDDKNVRMYLCGPTVYDRAHLGNARPVLVFDVLYRLLRHEYGADHVTYVRNFTDVDDRINATALARSEAGAAGSLEELIASRADETIAWYHADMDALGALRPAIKGGHEDKAEPRATEYIVEMVEMIEGLIAGGFAYAAQGHVMFRVRSYAEYGALSGRSVDDMIAGARVEVAPYKEDPMDFVLWKPSDDDLPGWESPWGRGRPGWHIECSAMAHALLGEQFDIHGGGNDLTFPHHENEIAQSRCAGHGFANIWLHNEMLQVEGKKMSKSLGNFFTVRDLLDQGVPGEVIRFVMLSTHYRKPMDWTEKKREEAEATIVRWYADINLPSSLKPKTDAVYEPHPDVVSALADDLNTSLAITHLRSLSNEILHSAPTDERTDKVGVFQASAKLLGLLEGSNEMFDWLLVHGEKQSAAKRTLSEIGRKLGKARTLAMETKDFSEVDAIKAMLIDAGVKIQMSKNSINLEAGSDFDPTKLEALK